MKLQLIQQLKYFVIMIHIKNKIRMKKSWQFYKKLMMLIITKILLAFK